MEGPIQPWEYPINIGKRDNETGEEFWKRKDYTLTHPETKEEKYARLDRINKEHAKDMAWRDKILKEQAKANGVLSPEEKKLIYEYEKDMPLSIEAEKKLDKEIEEDFEDYRKFKPKAAEE